MKKPKINLLPLIKVRLLWRNLIIFIISFIAIAIIVGYSWKKLRSLEYFKIKDVIANESKASEFSYLIGRNIFNIDLRNESNYISELYPNYYKIRLIRVLPNRVFVNFVVRRPLAIVKLYRYFIVDENRVLFDQRTGSQVSDLPVIVGLETKIFGAKSGKKYNARELELALDIIKELNNNKTLRDYKIKVVDVSKPVNTLLFLEGGLEIRIGEEDFKNRFSLLNTLLVNIKNDLHNIKYIDLRFKEPVIKFKNVNK